MHISRTFLDSNIIKIKRVKGIQNYKLSELMKLQHDPKKVIHNFSSYQLSDTEWRVTAIQRFELFNTIQAT